MNNKTRIKVVLCSYPGIFSSVVENIIQASPGIELVGLVYSQRIFSSSEGWLQSALRLVKISGLEYALLQFLQTDFYRILTSLLKRQERRIIPVLKTKDINNDSAKRFLLSLKPDVVLLANFNQKLSLSTIYLPKIACLNIHPSSLPKFKGVDPVFAALNAGEDLLGVSVHHVQVEFDTGELMAQATIPVKKNHSTFFHQLKLFALGAKLAAENIQQMPGKMNKQPQQGLGNYDSWPTKQQIKAFKQRGYKLITAKEFVVAMGRSLNETI